MFVAFSIQGVNVIVPAFAENGRLCARIDRAAILAAVGARETDCVRWGLVEAPAAKPRPFRPTSKFRAEWARLSAGLDYEAEERRKANEKGVQSTAAGVSRCLYRVAIVIAARWRAAGFTSVTLVDGLPRPEKPHAAAWLGRTCAICGRLSLRQTPLCDGPDAFGLVHQALEQGVPFGMRDGLPTAGVEPEAGDVLVKVSRATCRPERQERKAA